MLYLILVVILIILLVNYVPVGSINLGGNNIVGAILAIVLIIVILRLLGII